MASVEGYGFVQAFLDAHPDVRDMVNRAVAEGWDTTRFETALKGTGWYRSRTEAQRKWDLESAEDPTNATKLANEARTQVRNLAGQWGVSLTDQQVEDLARQIYVNGADDTTVRVALSGFTPAGEAEPTTVGGLGQNVEQLRRMAYDYGVPVSDSRLNSWSRDIVAGKLTADGLEGYFQQAASSLYPQFEKQLQAGMTTRDLFDPYMQIAQRTLEVSPEQIDLLDPKWVPVNQTPEGPQVLSLQDWQKKIRSDSSYGFQFTAGARDEAYGMTSRLARLFGNYG